jgi:hypothetical protein
VPTARLTNFGGRLKTALGGHILIKPRHTRYVNLALQGGGAHGAFTWGVLDRLLDDDGVEFGWISGRAPVPSMRWRWLPG